MNQPRICLAREYAPDTLLIEQTGPGVCTENLDPGVVVMKSAKDRV
jgi:hypothetical protein